MRSPFFRAQCPTASSFGDSLAVCHENRPCDTQYNGSPGFHKAINRTIAYVSSICF